jgi:hypothetical protein
MRLRRSIAADWWSGVPFPSGGDAKGSWKVAQQLEGFEKLCFLREAE